MPDGEEGKKLGGGGGGGREREGGRGQGAGGGGRSCTLSCPSKSHVTTTEADMHGQNFIYFYNKPPHMATTCCLVDHFKEKIFV